jgi:dienelactone hydrolase
MVEFAMSLSSQDESHFSREDVVQGVVPRSAWQFAPGRIWVNIENVPDSIRFYGSLTDRPAAMPIIFLEGDVIVQGNRLNNDTIVGERYLSLSSKLLQAEAVQFAELFKRPFINLARPGTYGSSGDHQQRRREREVALINTALDQLKIAFGWDRVDLAGQSGGGHLVASLIARRSDIRRAVIASGGVAIRMRNQEFGRDVDATGYSDFVDPLDAVADVKKNHAGEIIILTDPNDQVVSVAVQTAYVTALARADVEVSHRFIPAIGLLIPEQAGH